MPEIQQPTTTAQDTARIALGLMLIFAGTSHLTFARKPFKAQVPPWVPIDPDTVVLQSGIAEIALGTALLTLPQHKATVGRVAAGEHPYVADQRVARLAEHHDRALIGVDDAATQVGQQDRVGGCALAVWFAHPGRQGMKERIGIAFPHGMLF